MPWADLAALRASETYLRSNELRTMPEFRLRRFLEVYNAIHAKKLANGASPEEAEATAFAMAFASARRFQPTPSGATLETQRHLFATMAPLQFSQGGEVEDLSFEFLQTNLDAINSVVAGNAFNLDHAHGEPIGIIHRILLPSDIPADKRASLPQDAPFFTEASYFEGTPDELKAIRTVSAEWLDVKRKDGRTEVIIPDSFAITKEPATDQSLGIMKLATSAIDAAKRRVERLGAPSPKPYQSPPGSTSQEIHHMPGSDPDTPSPEIGALKEKVASLSTAWETEKSTRAALEQKNANLMAELTSATGRIAALEQSTLTAAANIAVDGGIAQGKLATADREYWVGEYRERGAEKFAAMLAKLPVSHIGVAQAKSANAQVFAAQGDAGAAIDRMAATIDSSLKNGRVL